jgi:hypothetical protein
MRTWTLLFRFYRIVPTVPVLMWALALSVLAVSATLAAASAGVPSAPLPALLVLQIFAASSGVAGPARRGYYDALLSRGIGRAQILCGHWLASVAPGAVCWAAVALLDRLAHYGDGPNRAVASGSLVALWLASSVPWAATVALPRFAAAIAWLMVLVSVLTALPLGQVTLIGSLGDLSWPGAMVVLVYPIGLVGQTLSPAQWTMVAPALVLSAVAPAAAFLWFTRTDILLEASQ